jgi:HipA-like protein
MRPRKAEVFHNGESAGYLLQSEEGYVFVYGEKYFQDAAKPSISLTLPKHTKEHRCQTLFPFFYGLLAEGENKSLQCRFLEIDSRDHFTRLIRTAHAETIGAITIREVENALR